MAKDPQFAIGIDVGSYRTRCVIAILEDEYVRFAGAGEADAAGWTRGLFPHSCVVGGKITPLISKNFFGWWRMPLLRLHARWRKLGPIPVEAHRFQPRADAPQIPDVNGLRLE